jgi:hypothetical protein
MCPSKYPGIAGLNDRRSYDPRIKAGTPPGPVPGSVISIALPEGEYGGKK